MQLLRSILVLAFLLSLAFSTVAHAQLQQTGNIVGRVVDASGGVLPGVTVELSSPSLVRPETAVTDAQGNYRFIQLPIGEYTLAFSLPGLTKLVREQIPVSADKTLTINVAMQIAGVQEQVTVIGEAPVVDVKSATFSVNLDRNAIDDLPTSRDIWSFLQNQVPQVVNTREDVGGSESGLQAAFSTHGSAWSQNTILFNGIDVTGVNARGTTDLYFDYDSFEEIQISTAAHKAEVPTPGVYLNVIGRSATNSWRGTLQFYITDDKLQSDNLTQELRDQGVARGQGIDRTTSVSAQFGGPLIKDRLRIYGNYRDDRTNRFVVGFPFTEDTIIKAPLVNATLQINDSNKVKATYTYNKYDKPYRGAGALLAPESTWIEDNHATVAGAEWQSTLTSDTLLNVRVGYVGQPFQLFLQPSATKPNTLELTTGEQTGAAVYGFQNKHARLQLSGFLSYYKSNWLGGSHDLKFGYDVSRGPNQAYIFGFEDVNLNTLNGEPFSVVQYNTPALPRELHWWYPFYAQDTFTFGKTTLSLGLRFDGYTGKVRETSVPAGRFVPARSFPEKKGPTFNNLVPRFSVVHDVFGNSKLAFKGSYGRYLNTAGSHWFRPISEADLAGRTYRWQDLNGDGNFQEGEERELLSSFGGSITSLDPDLRQAYSDEWTVGFDSEIGKDMRLGALFIYRREGNLGAITNPGVPFSAYTRMQALDPGVDGITGTGDDTTIEVFNQDPSTLGQDQLFITNPEAFKTSFRGFEVIAQKRYSRGWQWLSSFSVSDQEISATSVLAVQASFGGSDQEFAALSTTDSAFLNPNKQINNTGGPGFFNRTYIFKASGSYSLPGGIQVAGVFKAQSGTPYARVVTIESNINGVPLNQGSVAVYAEPRGSRHYPTLTLLDLRFSKAFKAGRHGFEAIVDIFNVTNANAITAINGNTGSQFGAPLEILGPRVVRLGARYSF